jgi:hypothetical protein
MKKMISTVVLDVSQAEALWENQGPRLRWLTGGNNVFTKLKRR